MSSDDAPGTSGNGNSDQSDLEQRAAERISGGDANGAEPLLREILRTDPRSAYALAELGVVCAQQERFSEAEQLFRRLAETNGRDPRAHNNLGNVYMELGRDEQALRAYRRAIDLDPEYVAAHQNLARLYKRTGDYEAFVRTLKTSYRLEARADRERLKSRVLRTLFRRRRA